MITALIAVVYCLVVLGLFYLKGRYNWKTKDDSYIAIIFWPIVPVAVLLILFIGWCILYPLEWVEKCGKEKRELALINKETKIEL